ncbi:MAG: hypothetical protein ACPGLV_15730 [Bacteroidia bacterium]
MTISIFDGQSGFDIKYSYQKSGFRNMYWSLLGNYSYTKTENLGQSIFVNEGTQLSYVPFHKLNQQIKLSLRSFNFIWHYQFVGKRFVNADNSQSLSPYHLNHFKVAYSSYRLPFNASAQINNLFNVEYESTLVHPMPLRNFSITINYNLNHLKKLW